MTSAPLESSSGRQAEFSMAAAQNSGVARCEVSNTFTGTCRKNISLKIFTYNNIFAPMFMDVGGWRNIENIDGRQHKTNIWVTVGNWRAASQLGKQAQVSVLR